MSGFKRRGKNNTKGSLYTDLSLPLHNFIRCIVHSDLSTLIISGNPKQEDIAEAWANIYAQYIDIVYKDDPIYIIELEKDIALLETHVSEVENSLYFLSLTYHEGCIRILKSNGYRDIIPKDDTERIKVLTAMAGKLAMKKLDLEAKQNEYKSYIKAHEKDEITEASFVKKLMILAKYQGVAVIRSKDITVLEFIMLGKEYNEATKERITEKDGAKG